MSEINDDIKLNHDKLKQKITSAVKDNNKVTFVYDSMIEDYNFLYKKYIDMQIAQEQKERLGSKTFTRKESILKMDNGEDINFLNDKYLKLKETNEKNLQEIKNHLENIMKLQEKLDTKDKRIKGYQAENTALKSQNIQLTQKNKELNKINDDNEKKIAKLNKSCQRMEIDHKKLIDDSVQMHQIIEQLNNRILDLEKKCLKNNIEIVSNDIREEINKSNIIPDIIGKNEINFSKKNSKNELPTTLKYKQKVHFKNITSINFNNQGDKYITTSEDKSLILLETAKNTEIFKFDEFDSVISEACFKRKRNIRKFG